MKINDIVKPVKEHIGEFDKVFKSLMKSDVALLNLVIRYMTRTKGKQVRPAIVMLAAELCGGVTPRAYVGAAMVELLHTATLVHDDVVDSAKERRGLASINFQWNNKIAVLVGDFLLSRGLLAAVDKDEFRFLGVTSRAVQRMSEGELLSIEKSRTMRMDEEAYFKITSSKTASLISACCEIGAMSACDDTSKHTLLADYGEAVGIAFQIRDDIFDYTSSSFAIGKPVGNDIKEKKITLPLLYVLNNSDKSVKNSIVKKIKTGKLDKAQIKEIIDFTIQNGGVDYADKVARDYSAIAINKLETFPDCIAKTALIEFAEYVVNRNS